MPCEARLAKPILSLSMQLICPALPRARFSRRARSNSSLSIVREIRQCREWRLPRARSYCQHICRTKKPRRRLYHSPNTKVFSWTLLFAFLSPLHHRSAGCIYVYTSRVYFLIRRVFYSNNRSFCLWHMHVRRISLLPPPLKFARLLTWRIFIAASFYGYVLSVRRQTFDSRAKLDSKVILNIRYYISNFF